MLKDDEKFEGETFKLFVYEKNLQMINLVNLRFIFFPPFSRSLLQVSLINNNKNNIILNFNAKI